MDAAREKLVSTTLFDVIAPRASATNASTSGSFQDCFAAPPPASTPTPSTQADSRPLASPPRQDSRPEPAAKPTPVSEAEKPTDSPSSNAASAQDAKPAEKPEEPHLHVKKNDRRKDKDKDAKDEVAANVVVQAQAAVPTDAVDQSNEAKSEQPAKTPDEGTAVEATEVAQPATATAILSDVSQKSVDTGELHKPDAKKNVSAEKGEIAAKHPADVVLADKKPVSVSVTEAVKTVAGNEEQVTKPGTTEEKPVLKQKPAIDAKTSVAKPLDADNKKAVKPTTVVTDDTQPAKAEKAKEGDDSDSPTVDPTSQSNAPSLKSIEPTTTATPKSEESAAVKVSTPDPTTAATPSPTTDALPPPPVAASLPTSAKPSESKSSDDTTPIATAGRTPPALLRETAGKQKVAKPTELDPAKFLSRVAKAFQSAQERQTEVKIRLHPPELGTLSVEVKVSEGALSARLQVESPEAKAAVLENLPMLQERLKDQGIRIEKFDVDLMDHSDHQPQQPDERGSRDELPRQVHRPTTSGSRRMSSDGISVANPATALPDSGKINIVV